VGPQKKSAKADFLLAHEDSKDGTHRSEA
jgi:hypothetical protein